MFDATKGGPTIIQTYKKWFIKFRYGRTNPSDAKLSGHLITNVAKSETIEDP